MGACCTKNEIPGGHLPYENDENDSNGGDDGEDVRHGDFGASVRLRGSSAFTSTFSQRGKKRVNQDAMTVWEEFTGEKDTVFCGVFDGHGPCGHRVARRARDVLPSKLSMAIKKQIYQLNSCKNGDSDASNTDVDNCRNLMVSRWEAAFVESFTEMDRELGYDSTIDSFCSGTTAVTIIKQGEHLLIANLGDSRAILCTRGDKNQRLSLQLTVDQKPNIPSEAERIKNCQGRVIAERDEPGMYRVWLPDEDYPGLAMSRSLGDFCLKDYGLISIPLVSYRKLTRNDEFVVLATDGIWDVLTNTQVVAIVASARNRSTAAELVVKLAVREWKRRYPGSVVDDCTVVCLFFKNPPLLTKSKSHVDPRRVSNRPELKASRSYKAAGREWNAQQELNRANSLRRLSLLGGSISHRRMEKRMEVEAR